MVGQATYKKVQSANTLNANKSQHSYRSQKFVLREYGCQLANAGWLAGLFTGSRSWTPN